MSLFFLPIFDKEERDTDRWPENERKIDETEKKDRQRRKTDIKEKKRWKDRKEGKLVKMQCHVQDAN